MGKHYPRIGLLNNLPQAGAEGIGHARFEQAQAPEQKLCCPEKVDEKNCRGQRTASMKCVEANPFQPLAEMALFCADWGLAEAILLPAVPQHRRQQGWR